MGQTNHNLDGTVERTSRYPYCRFYTGNYTSLSCFHLKTKTVADFGILCCNQLKNTTLIRSVVRESVRKQINMAYNFVTIIISGIHRPAITVRFQR